LDASILIDRLARRATTGLTPPFARRLPGPADRPAGASESLIGSGIKPTGIDVAALPRARLRLDGGIV
jgi:hypothetical protein